MLNFHENRVRYALERKSLCTSLKWAGIWQILGVSGVVIAFFLICGCVQAGII